MRNRLRAAGVLLTLACCVLVPATGSAIRCKRPPPGWIIYPYGKQAPRNAAVFVKLFRSKFPPVQARLYVFGKARAVRTRMIRKGNSSFLVLLPVKSLRARTTYEVRVNNLAIGRFTTTGATASAVIPKLQKARVLFSGPAKRKHRGPWTWCRGRTGWVVLSAPNTGKPTVIHVETAYSAKGSPGGRGNEVVSVYSRKTPIAWKCRTPCSYRTPYAAPLKGRYKTVVTPWSATGTAGKAVIVKGRIRTDVRSPKGLP